MWLLIALVVVAVLFVFHPILIGLALISFILGLGTAKYLESRDKP